MLEAIRADGDHARMPVILISGSPSNEARIQGLRLGADDYLVKPFSPRELLIKIRTILDRSADLRLLKEKTQALEEEARRYREDLRRSREEMQAYFERIGSLLHHVDEVSREQELPEVLFGLVRTCRRDLNLTRVCLLTRHEEGGFRPQAWQGLDMQALRGLRLDEESFLCQTLMLEGRTLTADELAGYPSTAPDLRVLAALGLTHMTPVRRDDGQLAAILAGGDREDGEPLDSFETRMIEVLAHSAGMAMSSAEVYTAARESFVDSTSRWIAAVEARYPELAGHSARVTEGALRLAERLGAGDAARTVVGHVARLHDLGSLDQYDHLFTERRAFSDEERVRIRRLAAEGVPTGGAK